MFCVDVQNRV